MMQHTYYDILGISADATTHEITNAKNALAKVYHPDVNIQHDIDTTTYMQKILEAYSTLSDPAKREQYDQSINESARVFRTYSLRDSDSFEDTDGHTFVVYWNAFDKLNEAIQNSTILLAQQPKKKHFPRLLNHLREAVTSEDCKKKEPLMVLAGQAFQCVLLLKDAGIAPEYWHADAMNWVLLRWGLKPESDYLYLFSRYSIYANKHKTAAEKARLQAEKRRQHKKLQKLLNVLL